MTTIWETMIRTGNPAFDQRELAQIKATYESQGHTVHVQPLPAGGMHVRVVSSYPAQSAQGMPGPQGMSPSPYGPPGGYGGGAYGAPPSPHGAYGYGAAPPHMGYSGPPNANGPYGNAPPPSPPAQQAQASSSFDSPPPSSFAFAGGMPGQAAYAVGGAAAPSLGAERVRYLRKVYGLLFIAAVLAIGAGMFVVSPFLGTETLSTTSGQHIEVPLVVAAMLQNPGLEYGAFALLFVGVLLASFVSKVRGLNYAALFAVSLLMGVELAPMAFVAQVLAGFGDTLSANPVRDAFAMVGAIFAGLTAYVFIARKDFSFLKATLSMGFMVVFSGCILAFILGSEPFSLAIATAGSILAIGFLLYQTSHIFRNSDMDDPVDDALGLIVQLRNLFMFLLRIFMSRR